MEETIRFCPNLVCKFYKVFPDGDSDIVAVYLKNLIVPFGPFH